jgi:hypothetical protein
VITASVQCAASSGEEAFAMPKKGLKFAGIALLVFYVVTQPQNAAGIVHSIGSGLQSAAVGFGQFITNLT